MNKKPCKRVLASMKSQQWAIRPEMLDALLAIAQRQYSDPVQASIMSEEYENNSLKAEDTPGIAIIDITGPIFARSDFFSDISGAASCDRIMNALDSALIAPNIKGIILVFDSPGGQVTGTHELAHYIFNSRDIKPIVSYISGAACSAAYWLASATSYIFTDRVSSLGCLGIVATWTDDSAAKEKQGIIEYELISSQTPNKRLSVTNDKGRSALQKELDSLADIFIDDVALFRGVSKEKVLTDFGQGGTLLADDAINMGMADELSSLRDVVTLLSEDDDNIEIEQTGDQTMPGFNRNANNKKNRLALNAQEDVSQENKTPEEIEEEERLRREEENNNTETQLDSLEEDEIEPIEEEEDPENAEEDEDIETEAINRNANKFSKSNPNLYKAILRRGARRERHRIEGIEGLEAVGRESIIQSAKFTKPRTIGATSRAILRAEKNLKEQHLANYKDDATFAHTAPSGAANGGGESMAAAEKAVLEQIKKGAMSKAGVKK